MKTSEKLFKNSARRILLGSLVCFINLAASAQSGDYVGKAPAGYWHLTTAYATQSTTIRFFNPHDEVIYEEQLPGAYVKMNRKNIALINEAFEMLVTKQVVQKSIKPSLLTELASHQQRNLARKQPDRAGATTDVPADEMQVALYPIQHKLSFRLMFHNPQGGPVDIVIQNADEEIIYREHVKNVSKYNRIFDLSGMGNVVCTVALYSAGNTFSRPIMLTTAVNRQTQILEPENESSVSELVQ